MLDKISEFLTYIPRKIFTKDGMTLHPGRVMVFGFLTVILTGAWLLYQPWATVQGEIRWIDAFFTATSATCVTGLVVVDTGTTFTFWGQVVILFLMQVGGLGIMTFSIFFVLSLGGRISFEERIFFKENVSFVGITNMLSVLKVVLTTVLIVELSGAAILFLKFWPTMALDKAAFYAIFHAVSAFCNAGFALWPDSLMQYRGDIVINLVFAILIIIGGIGFLVYEEIFLKIKGTILKQKTPPLSLQSRLVLITSGTLILLGALFIFLLEWGNSFGGFSPKELVLVSFFQSVTARTAGFNTVDLGLIANGTALIIVVLMFIGGSPASCAGGVKTTTFSIITLLILSKLKGKSTVSAFHRKLPSGTVAKALTLFFASCLFVFIMTVILEITETQGIFTPENRDKFVTLFFETVSAFGTVGLSMGVTPALTFAGKWVIIICMFVGRIGPLALALTVISGEKEELYQYPEESVMTG